jgi:hypothetical protein
MALETYSSHFAARTVHIIGSIMAAVMHGTQNAFASINTGLSQVQLSWAMAEVYGAVAVLIILLTRGRLGLTE